MNGNEPVSVDEVYEDMVNKIVNLEYEPGEKISENTICNKYGVSRSVIRVVFTRLAQRKLIKVYPQRGTYVSLFDLDYIQDLLLLRGALEKEILFEIFTEKSTKERMKLVKILRKNLKKQEKFYTTLNYEEAFKKLDSDFHREIIQFMERESLNDLLSENFVHINRWRLFDVNLDKRVPELIDEHKEIVDYLEKGDIKKTMLAVNKHLDTVNGIREKAHMIYPQYFKDTKKP